jgi:hypothetical protein
MHYWQVWYPKAGATGVYVARGAMDPTDSVILHSAPDIATVEVYDENGNQIAKGEDLERTLQSPMCRFTMTGDAVTRKDIWPNADDIGTLVLLPGGEVGVLKAWWNAGDKKEWRWQIEFYNSIR